MIHRIIGSGLIARKITRYNLWVFEAFLGVIKEQRIGFELNWKYVPARTTDLEFLDLGGLGLVLKLFF